MNLDWIDTTSFFLITCELYFLCVLSIKLGDVLGMKKYYYLYYAGMFFTLTGSFITLILLEGDSLQIYGYIFFAFGMTLGLLASLKYWGWLIKEILRG